MKQAIVTCLAIILIVSTASRPAFAHGGGGHFGGGGGGWGGGGGHYGGYGGGWGYGRGGYYGGYYGGIGIGIYGPGLGYYGSPYYSPYYTYPPAAVTVPAAPPVYIQQSEPQPAAQPQANYWHYCRDPEGYYPYVKECPGGWQQVAPRPSDR